MAIIIKKISRKTWFSVLSFLGVALALLTRLLLGGASMHLGKLETSAKNTLKDSVVSTAYADAADCPSGSGDNGCSDDGCGGSGAGDSGGF